MTPAEEAGFKIGNVAVVTVDDPGGTFSLGSVIQLEEDDNTTCPLWALLYGSTSIECELPGDRVGAYCYLFRVEKVEGT